MDKHYVHKTGGKVCAREIRFDLVDGRVRNVEFVGGCKGNSSGVARLAEGMPARQVACSLAGIQCHGDDSCPNELAKAVNKCLEECGE